MNRKSPFSKACCASFVVFLILLVLSGCGSFSQSWPDTKKQEDLRNMQMGYSLFQEGNYLKASEIFEKIGQHSEDEKLRQEALYDLACAQLILADNNEEFREAFALWNRWSQAKPEKFYGEDPRLFRPFLEKISTGSLSTFFPGTFGESEDALFPETTIRLFEVRKPVKANSDDSSDNPPDNAPDSEPGKAQPVITKPSKSVTVDSDSKMAVQRLLQSREKEVRQLRGQVGKMKKEIEILKNQLSSLEEIHQGIQEKKKDMAP
jgi:hypothetical protein